MPETTMPLDGEVTSYMCITRANGDKEYRRLVGGVETVLTEAEYESETGE